jgi:hypothetical protein
MTPKEKAVELIDFFTFNCKECDNAKISALIAVDQMLGFVAYDSHSKYLLEVKQEIELL